MDSAPLMAGLIVLGVILLLVIIVGGLAIYFILMKLRQHERDILELSGNKSVENSNKRKSFRDSAIELNEIKSDMSDGRLRPLSQTSAISNSRSVHHKMSLIIKKEECRVYGERPPFGQILATAQNYFKVTTNTDTVVPTEEVQVIDTVSKKRTVISKVFYEDWREGLPTSLLLNADAKSFQDVFSLNKGVFVHRTIGTKGGHLEVSGISLKIPEGALEKETLITLGAIWDERYLPTLTKKKAMLSPIVLCQPSGIKFNIPVTLNIPHSAARITQDWIPTVIKREGPLSEQSEWKPITLEDYDEREISDTRIILKLRHFTLYSLVGESKPGKTAAKVVHIVAYTGKLQKDIFFKPRLYCLDRYKELEEVETLTTKMDASAKLADTADLFIHDNGEDVTIEVNKISEEWSLTSERMEVLLFEQVWHSLRPHCTFFMKQKTTYVKELLCEFHAYQNGAENTVSKLKIAEQIQRSLSPLSTPEEDPVECLIRQLVILLDPVNTVGSDAGDWKDLASKMGCEISRIRWLGTQSSPTRVLLDKWLEEKQGQFEELEQIMKDINRPDAAEEVHNAMNKL